MDIKFLQKIKLPNKPGIYLFKKNGEILYIGKATSLKDRVKSYFGKDLMQARGPLLVDLILKADKINWQETDSVLEALILEANLIKKYQPKYNTKEKSDKSFNYVCITKEELPKVILLRERKLLGIHNYEFQAVFGPFPTGNQLREALKIIRKIFPFFDEKRGTKGRDEFYKQIKLTPLNSIENKNNIKNIKLLFEGKKKKILKNLNKKMKEYAKNQEFEKAGEIKRQIFALKHINDVALIKGNNFADNKIFDPAPFFGRRKGDKVGPSDTKILLSAKLFKIEAYDVAHMSGKNMVGVMVFVENGELKKDKYRKFSARGGSAFGGKTILNTNRPNDVGALAEILERRFAHTEWEFPDLIVVDGGIAQKNVALKILNKLNIAIPVVSVIKDEKHKPKAINGNVNIIKKYKKEILLANNEAHRFAISYHKNMRTKTFLKK
ncbi:MAG: UvrB/UvrC motif-containing protein [Candidatus Paceibacterota bacterium]|jgi:excinuclease ABC subunit C